VLHFDIEKKWTVKQIHLSGNTAYQGFRERARIKLRSTLGYGVIGMR
jgi:hypothetical protein